MEAVARLGCCIQKHGFLAELKAQSSFGRAGDGDASGARYLFGGVVEETHASFYYDGAGF
jgi:hypothetical protein